MCDFVLFINLRWTLQNFVLFLTMQNWLLLAETQKEYLNLQHEGSAKHAQEVIALARLYPCRLLMRRCRGIIKLPPIVASFSAFRLLSFPSISNLAQRENK